MSKSYTIGAALSSLLRDGMPLRFTAYDGSSAGPADSAYGIELLNERAPVNHLSRVEASLGDADPYGLDLHLALYVCYELHYRGFDGVDPGRLVFDHHHKGLHPPRWTRR